VNTSARVRVPGTHEGSGLTSAQMRDTPVRGVTCRNVAFFKKNQLKTQRLSARKPISRLNDRFQTTPLEGLGLLENRAMLFILHAWCIISLDKKTCTLSAGIEC
jgi:hypothetical protein